MPEIHRRAFDFDERSTIDAASVRMHVQMVEAKHAGMQRRSEHGKPNARLSLRVQFFDAYSYQRELTIERRREAGASMRDASRVHWTVSAYKHPFRPATETRVSEGIARRLIARLWELANEYPILLLNEPGEGKLNGQHSGLVHFHESLLAGARPSVDLLP